MLCVPALPYIEACQRTIRLKTYERVSQKSTQLRLSHLSAVAVMIALVGAMFVSLGSAQAADPKIGDISHTYGFCAYTQDADETADPPEMDEYTLVTTQPADDALVNSPVEVTVKTSEDDALVDIDIHCTEDDVRKPFTISPDGTSTPNIAIADPVAALIVESDQDGVLEGGDTLQVGLYLANWATANSVAEVTIGTTASELDLAWVQVAGPALLEDGEGTGREDLPFLTGTFGTRGIGYVSGILSMTLAKGVPDGEYTVSARLIWDTDDKDSTFGDNANAKGSSCDEEDYNDADPPECVNAKAAVPNDDEVMDISAKFTIGDAGSDVGSVSLTLANEKEDNPLTTAIETKAETGTAPAKGGDIWLKASSLTSLGTPTSNSAVKSITFLAPGADLEVYDDGSFSGGKVVDHEGELRSTATLAGANIAEGNPMRDGRGDNSVQVNNPGTHTLWVKVSKEDREPGTVEIYAIVVGDGSSQPSERVPLIFSGPATTLELGEANAVAVGKKTEFSVNAVDAGGNEAGVSQVGFSVKDADGKTVPGSKIEVTQGNTGDSTDTPADDNPNEVAGIVKTGPQAEPGVYTVTVSLVGSRVSESTEIIVGGKADAVALAADPETGDAADQTLIKVTATVTDKNGALVVDGTRVEFSALGRNLAPIGPGHAPIESQIQKQLVNVAGSGDDPEFEERALTTTVGGATTKDGEVSVTFIVTGSGTATVNATTEGGSASGNLRITTSDTSAGDAMPEEEASVSCLSELSGFATWSCGVEADASEIFGMVSGRGVTAIHLWNGSTWVRYSVVDGAMVPGSSDFMVTENDILYISN